MNDDWLKSSSTSIYLCDHPMQYRAMKGLSFAPDGVCGICREIIQPKLRATDIATGSPDSQSANDKT